MTEPTVPSAITPFCPPVTVKPTSRQYFAPSRWKT